MVIKTIGAVSDPEGNEVMGMLQTLFSPLRAFFFFISKLQVLILIKGVVLLWRPDSFKTKILSQELDEFGIHDV